MTTPSCSLAKKAVGYAAAEQVQSGMVVGLGTGSTANFFIERLIERQQEGLKIQVVPTSLHSQQQALNGKIPLADLQTLTQIDLTVDGADEIDSQKRMIKGGGGALLREKIVANLSHQRLIIVDSTKVVKHLGNFPLPVEVTPFAIHATIDQLHQLGYQGLLRKNAQNGLYVTDNGNYIFDIHLTFPLVKPEEEEQRICSIPGVLETGFFFHLAQKVLIGLADGTIKVWS